GKRLVAYVVPEDGSTVDGNALRTSMRSTLPEYMVPSAVMILDQLPLTPNGKIDRKALPEPAQAVTATERLAPRNATEERLMQIFAAVLGIQSPGVNESFF